MRGRRSLEDAVRRALTPHARPVRAGAAVGRRSRASSSPRATARRSSSASATASTSSPPTSRPSSSHTRDVVFLGDEEMAVVTPARRGVHATSTGTPVIEGARSASRGIRSGREGRLQALHAQGDLRAAAGGPRHHPRAASRSRRAACSSTRSTSPTPTSRAIDKVDDPRVRHVLARRAGRQVPDRGAGRAAGRGGLRVRVPLPQPDRRRADAGRRDHAVGRDGRHAGRAARGHGARARAASPSATSSAAWPRARADGTIYTHAGPEIGVASTKAFTSQLVALYLLALHLGAGARDADARRGAARTSRRCSSCRRSSSRRSKASRRHRGGRAAVPPAPRLPVPRPRHQLPDRPRGRAEAEGDLVHPRRGVPGRRDEARADRAHRRAHAGGGARAARSRVREDARQHPGSEGPRRLGHRRHHGRRRAASATCSTRRPTSWSRFPSAPPPAHAGRLRRCRCSCSRTTSPSAAAATSISRGTWRRASR